MIKKITTWYKNHPDKKRVLDYITAFLTIPLLITVITANVMNIKSNKKEESVNETTNTPAKIFITEIPQDKGGSQGGITIIPLEITKESQSLTSAECKKEIGPIDIVYPKENQRISEDPLCIEINYQQGNYCSVVWSYRLNEGKYSDYNDKAPCLYNLPAGNATFDMRVKSVASAKELFITRSFTVDNVSGGSPTPIQNITPNPANTSPTLTPS